MKRKKPVEPDLRVGRPVVCLDARYCPSTWGIITCLDGTSVRVLYGKDAAIWFSDWWERDYVIPCRSEAEARQRVEDFQNSRSAGRADTT
jgi:hypothetical protein